MMYSMIVLAYRSGDADANSCGTHSRHGHPPLCELPSTLYAVMDRRAAAALAVAGVVGVCVWLRRCRSGLKEAAVREASEDQNKSAGVGDARFAETSNILLVLSEVESVASLAADRLFRHCENQRVVVEMTAPQQVC